MKLKLLILFLILIFSTNIFSQELSRRASFKASISWPDGNIPGVIIKEIHEGSPLLKSGIQQGDIILQINGELVCSPDKWSDQLYALRGNMPTNLLMKRKQKVWEVEVMLKPLAKESHENIDTYYTHFISDYGIKQRVIITKPKNANAKLPGLLLLQGLSCSSVEKYTERGSNWSRVINDIVEKTGMVVLRVEKPGVGDSEGNCSETDFLTELNGYRKAAAMLKSLSYVDSNNVIIYGASMGSALAPLIANEFNYKAIISDGVFFKTWFEHMLEIERRIRQMSGDDESTIAKKMNEVFIPLYYGMLIEKKSFEELVTENPLFAEYNYHSPKHMYGRPLSYYQQLQVFDLAKAWEEIQVPVKIMRGTNDWIMSDFDNEMIIDVLKRNGHKKHELFRYEGLDHWNTVHQSAKDSFEGKTGEWQDNISGIIVRWAKELVDNPN